MALRIYADFNSGGSPGHGSCWLLRYGPKRVPLDEIATELGLRAGVAVTLFYEDQYGEETEGFEVSAVLEEHDERPARWRALPDWSTRRDIGHRPP